MGLEDRGPVHPRRSHPEDHPGGAPPTLVLLANLRVGLHEQIRLQDPIVHALMSSPVYRLAPQPLRRRLDTAWKNLATGQLMDIRLPGPRFEHTGELTAQSLGSAANDWSELADRMNFVADLFRVWQQDQRLYLPPFTREQINTIRARYIPLDGPPL